MIAAESEADRAEADRISGSAADDLARLRLRSARGAAEPNPAFDADGQPECEMILPDGAGVSSVIVGGFAVPLGDDGVGTSHIYGEFQPSAAGAGRLGATVQVDAEGYVAATDVLPAGGAIPTVALDADGYVVADAVRQDHGTGYSSMAAYASAAAAADPAVDSRA